jgi:tetratricopeptide (TPR) repeat protein
LVSWVAGRSRGNPLFIEELVTGLREEDRIQLQQGRWRITGSGVLGVPAGIQALIGERAARLDLETRRLLWLCAVANRELDFGLLHELAEIGEEVLLDALDVAVAAGLLEETAPAGRAGYAFHHPLIAEAVYGAAPAQRRVLLHRRVARALERRFAHRATEHATELAWHFGQAGSHEQAAHYSVVAGEQAAAAYANAEALVHFTTARQHLVAVHDHHGGAGDQDTAIARLDERIGDLRLLMGECAAAQEDFARARQHEADPARRAELWRKEGSSWVKRGAYERALAAFDAAEQEQHSLPPAARAAVQFSRGEVFYRQGDFAAAEQVIQQALALVGDESRGALPAAHGYNLLGNVAFRRGDYPRAEEYYRASLAARERAGDQGGAAASWHNLGNVAQDRGALPEAEACFLRSLSILERMGDQARVAISLNSLGTVALQRGAPMQAADWYRRALAISERIEDRAGMANSWRCLGNAAQCRGDLTQANAYYGYGLTLWEQLGDPVGIASCWSDLGEVACDRGDLAAAARFARRARHLGRRMGVPRREALAALGQARAHLLAGHLRPAAAFVHYGWTLATAQGLVKGMVVAALLSADLQLQQGAIAEARATAEQALQLAAGAQSACDEGRARRLLGRCLLAGGAFGEAMAHVQTSLQVFERLGADLELARTRLALAEALAMGDVTTGEQSSLAEAQALVAAARSCFAERGAAWDLAQADRLGVRLLAGASPG